MKYRYNPGDDDERRDAEPDEQTESQKASQTSEPTALGIGENVVGALTYLLGWVTGIVFLLIEKENKFVRFHALQSVIVSAVFTVASIIADSISIRALGVSLSAVVTIGWIVTWLLLMYQALNGVRYKVPYAGDYAEKQIEQSNSD